MTISAGQHHAIAPVVAYAVRSSPQVSSFDFDSGWVASTAAAPIEVTAGVAPPAEFGALVNDGGAITALRQIPASISSYAGGGLGVQRMCSSKCPAPTDRTPPLPLPFPCRQTRSPRTYASVMASETGEIFFGYHDPLLTPRLVHTLSAPARGVSVVFDEASGVAYVGFVVTSETFDHAFYDYWGIVVRLDIANTQVCLVVVVQ